MAEETWEDIAGPFAQAVRDYYVERGHSPDASNVESSVRTNSSLVPSRGDLILEAFRELAGIDSITDLAMVDLGSGWGSLTAYLAWRGEPGRIVAVDNRADFVASARSSFAATGLDDRVEFLEADIARMPVADGAFDIAVANNVLVYLSSPEHLAAALTEVHRVLRPGGTLVVHQANRWKWRDPFTDDPFVHLLPPRFAAPASRVTGWRDDHDRIRLVSPPAFRRALRRAGFEYLRAVTPTSDGIRRGSAWVGKFFVIAARKPAGDDNKDH